MHRRTVPNPPSDQELATAAGAGDSDAFEELYRRHLPAATGVALAVAGNRDDAGDAVAEGFTRVLTALPSVHTRSFRSYLLTATRHAAIDIHRRSGRVRPTSDVEALDASTADEDPADMAVTSENAALLAQAFARLPERWRSVLWLLEVERVPAHEVASALGLSRDNVAQIGVRARSRLRESYLQAHLGPNPEPACEFTARRLGAYLNATLSRRDVTKADKHLQTCTVCRHRRDDLEGLGLKLRSCLPVPLGVLPVLRARSRPAGAPLLEPSSQAMGAPMGSSIGSTTVATVTEPLLAAAPSVTSGLNAVRAAVEVGISQVTALTSAAPLVQRLVGGASAALVAIGVSTIAVRSDVVGGNQPPSFVTPPATASVSPGGAGPGGAGGPVPSPVAGSGLLGAGQGAGSAAGPSPTNASGPPSLAAAVTGTVAAAVPTPGAIGPVNQGGVAGATSAPTGPGGIVPAGAAAIVPDPTGIVPTEPSGTILGLAVVAPPPLVTGPDLGPATSALEPLPDSPLGGAPKLLTLDRAPTDLGGAATETVGPALVALPGSLLGEPGLTPVSAVVDPAQGATAAVGDVVADAGGDTAGGVPVVGAALGEPAGTVAGAVADTTGGVPDVGTTLGPPAANVAQVPALVPAAVDPVALPVVNGAPDPAAPLPAVAQAAPGALGVTGGVTAPVPGLVPGVVAGAAPVATSIPPLPTGVRVL